MRDQFLFYRSYYEALKSLPKEEQADILMAIAGYALDESEPELDGVSAAIFTLVKPTLDKSNARSDAGKKGGTASKTEANASKTENPASKTEANASKTEAIKDKGYEDIRIKDKGKNDNARARESEISADVPSICRSICDEFNRLTGGNYRAEAPYISDLVISLLSAGYTEDDMLTVIRKMYAEWKDNPEMCTNIKPTTLLGKRFGEYLDRPVSKKAEKKSERNRKMEELMLLNAGIVPDDTG